MNTIDLEKQMFFDNPGGFETLCNTKYLMDEPAGVIEVENGIVLPLKGNYFGTSIRAEGGICDSKGLFVAGHITHYDNPGYTCWRICNKAYTPNEKIIKRNETVIFGGVLGFTFGHYITEHLSRLWYIVKNPDILFKIIFLNLPDKDGLKFENILQAFGLKKEQYEIISVPTQFDKIIVPDQSLYLGTGYKKEQQLVYDHIISNIKPSFLKKIYLSKSKCSINNSNREIYFEEFYKKRGFEIIYPETLPFIEQVAILNGADEIVCSVGTIQHLTFFCKDNAKVTILSRTYDKPNVVVGMFPIQMRNLENYFVDITYNFMQVDFNASVYFIGPTKHWINYLDSQNISNESEEVSFDINVKPYVYDYLIQWAKHYNGFIGRYNRIKNNTLPDVINTIYRTFLDQTIDTKKFPERDDVLKLRGDNDALKKEIEAASKNNQNSEILAEHKKLQQKIDKITTLFENQQKVLINSKNKEIEQLKQQLQLSQKEITQSKQQLQLSQKEITQSKQQLQLSQKEITQSKQQLQLSKKEINKYKGQVSYHKSKANKLKGQVKYHKKERENLTHSFSFKIGRIFTWLPRKIRNMFN